jgi:hypothetical protein
VPKYPALPPEIKELMRLVRAGRLFDVQQWIKDGKPTVPPEPYCYSPLRVAVRTEFHSMIEVLLRAGGIDQDEKNYLLYHAVWNADFEVIQLFERYGLLLWAGANPHERLPDIDDIEEAPDPDLDSTAIEEALGNRHAEIFDTFKIDPEKDDLDRLLDIACSHGSTATIGSLLSLGADPNPPKSDDRWLPMERLVTRLVWNIERRVTLTPDIDGALDLLMFLAERGGRWKPHPSELKGLRSALLSLDRWWAERVLNTFLSHPICSGATLRKLVDTPQMKTLFLSDVDRLREKIRLREKNEESASAR